MMAAASKAPRGARGAVSVEAPASAPRRTGVARVPRFPLDSGAVAALDVAWECAGAPGTPLLVVLGGISASRHVARHAADPAPGWWDAFVGPAGALDTRRWQVLGIDWIGGAGGSTGARRLPAAAGGAGASAGTVTTYDQARAVVAVLDALGVARAHAVIGASYGGMVALALAAAAPVRVGHTVVISAADRSHPMATALRSLQRQVVRLGMDSGSGARAVAIARGIALTTYRTAPEFAARFDCDGRGAAARLESVNAYLAHNGCTFARRFDADAFLCLSESLDLHEVEPATVRTPVTLVAVASDTLVPPAQIRALQTRLDAPATLYEIESVYGHDAFLKERAAIAPILNSALGAGGTS